MSLRGSLCLRGRLSLRGLRSLCNTLSLRGQLTLRGARTAAARRPQCAPIPQGVSSSRPAAPHRLQCAPAPRGGSASRPAAPHQLRSARSLVAPRPAAPCRLQCVPVPRGAPFSVVTPDVRTQEMSHERLRIIVKVLHEITFVLRNPPVDAHWIADGRLSSTILSSVFDQSHGISSKDLGNLNEDVLICNRLPESQILCVAALTGSLQADPCLRQ